MMKLPITIISGFLEAGKTSYINYVLRHKDVNQDHRILIISMEQGSTDYLIAKEKQAYVKIEHFDRVDAMDAAYLENCHYLYDEVLLEYNGTWPMASLLKQISSRHVMIKRIECVVDAGTFPLYIKNIDAMSEHMRNSDAIIVSNVHEKKQVKEIWQCLRALMCNTNIYVMTPEDVKAVKGLSRIVQVRRNGFTVVFIICVLLLIFMMSNSILTLQTIATFHRMFFSIVLQATPFLLLGIVCSSILQMYVSDDRFAMYVLKHRIIALPMMIVTGCMLPLCDCAMVPISEKFIQKGIPPSLTMVFFCISSSINPIVILSTYYAFPQQPSYIWIRIVASIVISLIVGLIFHFFKDASTLLKTKNRYLQQGYDVDIQRCIKEGKLGKVNALGLHITNEFLRIMVFVIAGALLSSIIQALHTTSSIGALGVSFSMIYMLLASMFLSICASSNAFIAKGFTNSLPIAAVFPFMVFGPLLDIKNMLILSSRFKRRFMIVYCSALLLLFVAATYTFKWLL